MIKHKKNSVDVCKNLIIFFWEFSLLLLSRLTCAICRILSYIETLSPTISLCVQCPSRTVHIQSRGSIFPVVQYTYIIFTLKKSRGSIFVAFFQSYSTHTSYSRLKKSRGSILTLQNPLDRNFKLYNQ